MLKNQLGGAEEPTINNSYKVDRKENFEYAHKSLNITPGTNITHQDNTETQIQNKKKQKNTKKSSRKNPSVRIGAS